MSYPRSLIPLLLREDPWWADTLDRHWYQQPTTRLFDQHFGQPWDDTIEPVVTPPTLPTRTLARQYSRTAARPRGAGFSEVTNDTNQFQVKLDVAHFGPSEITVKAVEGNTVIIEGKHEEKQDEHGQLW